MGLCILVRHGESLYNVEKRINGNPAIEVPLSDHGREEASRLALHLAHVRIDVCVHTRFLRTIETARLALGDRVDSVPFVCEPLLDDINAGELEGRPIADFSTWTAAHGLDAPFPGGGESVHDAGARFARGYRALAARPESVVLAVCHELPIRFALNAAAGVADPARPKHRIANADPYLFEHSALKRAADTIEQLRRPGAVT
ncbi:MAG: 2,3-bisphosphoglycerate-dependent phosphoglycerate mutase [Solirubrobacteraceae bacterium]|nr:2,3-bisphosphoglycerate-dependent phosphoglycerate mutase [Solirubrobacteraceae bacterium]